MNEKDILRLELAGFTYKDGFIFDKEGNFLENVEINGTSYSSGISKEDYESFEEAENIYQQNRLLEEQAKNQQRQDLLDYSENPLLFYTPVISDEYKNTEATSTKKNETLQITNTLTVSNDEKSTLKIMYKYPIVLVASIFIFLLIKKLIK